MIISNSFTEKTVKTFDIEILHSILVQIKVAMFDLNISHSSLLKSFQDIKIIIIIYWTVTTAHWKYYHHKN